MSTIEVSTSPLDGQLIPFADQAVSVISQSLSFVMQWQETELPPRLAIGNGHLRKLTLRIRKQPTNFMIIVHQSLAKAELGQNLCIQGLKATNILLGEGEYPDLATAEYMKTSLSRIGSCAAELIEHTAGIRSKFRLLRTVVLAIHKDLNEISTKQQRLDVIARLSRYFSKDVKACELALLKIHRDILGVEESLDTMIYWWQKVNSQANYLQMNGHSSENPLILREIQKGFRNLGCYFDDYLAKMSQLHDANLAKLNREDKAYLEAVQDHTDLVISASGSLIRQRD